MIVIKNDDGLQLAVLEFAANMEKSVDVDTGRKLAWARSALLSTLENRKKFLLKQDLDQKTLDMIRPFSSGLWYAKRLTHFDGLKPQWGHVAFEPGEAIIVLRCAGYMRGLGSYWWIVDARGLKRKVLWRFRPTFNQDWEKG